MKRPLQRPLPARAGHLGLLAGLLFATAACEDSFIDPFDNEDRYYTIYVMGGEAEETGSLDGRYFVPYGRAGARTEDGGWRFTISLSGDKAYVDDAFAVDFYGVPYFGRQPYALSSTNTLPS